MALILAIKGQDSNKAVELLKPDIKLVFKEKLDQLPNEVLFHIK